MRNWRIVVVALIVVLSVIGTASAASQKTVIHIGHKWDEAYKFHLALVAAAQAFEARNPNISVEINPGWTDDKYKIAVATGDAPDAQVLFDAPTWAFGGYIQPLDPFLAKYNIQRKDFVPAAWDQSLWQKKLYALRLQVDPNFGFVWNKSIFGEVGLNPDAPPKTVADFDVYFKRLTLFSSDGKPLRLGMTPWVLTGGNANTVYTWGWLFGGEWWDYQNNKATAHHPGNIKALDYLTDYFERYADAYTTLGQGIPSGLSRFTSGREAMALMTPSNANLTRQANPDMSIGVSKMFNNPQAGVENATWIGGWDIALTAGTKQADAAFQFIQFVTCDPVGVAAFSEVGAWMPSNIKTPYFRKLGSDPQWQVYTDTVVNAVKYRPAVPVLGTYSNQLSALFPKIIRRQVTPSAAMEQLSKQLDAEFAEQMKAK